MHCSNSRLGLLDSELAVAVVCKKDTKNNRYIYNIKLNWESIKDIGTLYVSEVEVFLGHTSITKSSWHYQDAHSFIMF